MEKTDRLLAIIAFLQEAEKLKDTLRSGRTVCGRSESTAEHSWRLCLMIMAFSGDLADYDLTKMLKLAIVHDLGEAIHGDTPATEQHLDPDRAERERHDMDVLCAALPESIYDEMMNLWDDYAQARTPEACMVKGFDKLETMMQHLIGSNASDFDYGFNLTYGAPQTQYHPLLRELRSMIDNETRKRI